jgi:hypothetical protein
MPKKEALIASPFLFMNVNWPYLAPHRAGTLLLQIV